MKKFFSVLLVAAMAVSMVACGGAAKPAAGKGDIVIGGIGPVTGDYAQYGQAVKYGAEIAIEEINALGGLQFIAAFEDDEADPEKSVNAYNALKDTAAKAKKPLVVLGSTTSGACIAVGSETYADNVFQLTPSGTDAKCVQYDNAFRTCFSDPNQGKASAQYLGANKLADKVGIIYDSSNTYSDGIRKTFEEEAANQGFEIVAVEAFTADTKTDLSVQIQKMQEAGAELVFLPIYYSEAATILKQANDAGYKPQFFGCDGMDGILTVENFDTTLAEGLMLLTPFVASAPDAKTQEFVKKYTERYDVAPSQFAADSYDSVYAIYEACKKVGATGDMTSSELCDALKTAILEISIDGLTGKDISWNADGEPNKLPMAAKIENGEYVLM